MTENRIFAVGDVHGCAKELLDLIGIMDLREGDKVVFLGDYIDRGKQSMEVLDIIIDLSEEFKVITLKGNHESMMQLALSAKDGAVRERWAYNWIMNGGMSTLESYGTTIDCLDDRNLVTEKMKIHLNYINKMPEYYMTDTHIFVHATPRPDTEIGEQSTEDLLWRRSGLLETRFGHNHISGKIIISGHTPQSDGKPKFLSKKNIIIDTGCFTTGVLTAMNIGSGEFLHTKNEVIK